MKSLVVALTFTVLNSWAQGSGSVSIPLNTVKKPAADLVGSDGQVLDVGYASQMAESGFDLSVLNPQENRMWQNQKHAGQEATTATFPDSEVGVQFLSSEAERVEVFSYIARVASAKDPNTFYRMTLSRYSHNTLMRATLLRKLGFYVPSPRYYPKLRVYFKNEEEKQEFIRVVSEEVVLVDLTDRGWILENDSSNHSLLLSDLILEVPNPEYYDIANGTAPDPNHAAAAAAVQRLSRYRAYRSLIVPYVLLDIPESINRYSPKIGSVMAGHIIMTYPYAASFAAATVEDVRWITRRLLELSEADMREVVKAGQFPAELEELIYAKMIYRLHNAAELMNLKSEFHFQLPSLAINSSSGLVKDGKVTTEKIPGYPLRFAHGDREAPFQDGDFEKYLGIRGRSALLQTALGEVSKRLQFLTLEDAATGRRSEIQQRIMDHIRNKPNEPLYQKVEAWGGPVAGFNISANRMVSTGTYYDSSAPIQLVDNISVSAQLGYFVALDGLPKVTPFGGANLAVMRDYTHVRPISSMEEGGKVSWTDLMIPTFMKNLVKVLESEKTEVVDGDGKIERHSLDVFLSELKEGEVFTVTDSVVTSVYAQASSSLDVLLGLSPLNFMNSISLGADANRVIMLQTSIIKTPRGLQVFVRRQNNNIFGLTLDVNYFINLIRIRAQTQNAHLTTDAFILDYNSTLAENANAEEAEGSEAQELEDMRRDLRPAISSLFRYNDPSFFYKSFEHKKFNIDHKLKTKELRTKFLFWRASSFKEDHWAQVLYPISKEAPELNPEDEKLVLFSHKRGELVGRDLMGFGLDLLEGIINRRTKIAIDLGGSDDPNPANVPFGKAYWRIANTEAELSPKGERYPQVSVLSHVWGGWKIKREKFFVLLDEIAERFTGTPAEGYRLIEKEAFMNVQSVDFYRVSAILSVLPSGVEKIRNLITQPGVADNKTDKAKFLSGLFQRLSQRGKGPRPQEKEMYSEILRIMGNNNLAEGEAAFQQACDWEHRDREGSPIAHGGYWRHGNYYECLTPWMQKLMDLSSSFPEDETEQVRWMTQVIYLLDEYIPMAQLLQYLGEENFIFTVRINGFRTGDEDADLEYFSNTIGDPKENIDYANGLFQMFANKTGIAPVELDRTLGGFK